MSKQITAKSVGKNVILIIEDVKYSRAFATKEERTAILDKVKAYNAKNSAAKLKELIKDMNADVEAKTEEVKAVKEKKASKVKDGSKPPKTVKPAAAEAIVPAQSIEAAVMFLLDKGYSVQKIQEKPTVGARRTGEW